MIAQRIKTGFHILGLTLAGVSLVMVLAAIWNDRNDPIEIWTVAWLAAMWIAYPAVLAVGLIIADFCGDADV